MHTEATTIGAYEVKTHWSAILAAIKNKGSEYVVTRHGKPVARIVPEHD